jgi:hypothetical protein
MQSIEPTNGHAYERTMYVLPCELPAIDEVVEGYLRILTAIQLPDKSAWLATHLRAFRKRYQPLLRTAPATGDMVAIRALRDEVLAFCIASLGYARFWQHDAEHEAWRRHIVTRVLTVHQRYTACLLQCEGPMRDSAALNGQ